MLSFSFSRVFYIHLYEHNQKGELVMDVFKITSKVVRDVLNGFLTKIIKKKYGSDIDIQINDLDLRVVGGKVLLQLDANAEMTQDEFTKISKKLLN